MSIDAVPPPELLTVGEAAEILRVSVTTVRRLQRQRKVAFHKVKGVIRFAKDDVISYLKAHRVGPIE